MSENDTLDYNMVYEDGEFLIEEGHHENKIHYIRMMRYVKLYCLPFLIVIGVSSSLLVLTILIRRRLWIHHEAYLYMAAILVANSFELMSSYGDWRLKFFDYRLWWPLNIASILCKFSEWLFTMVCYVEWLQVLLLFDVYLHLQQPSEWSERKGCCANLAVKYCSMLGTKVVLGSYFIVSALSTFWTFSIATLESGGVSWYCVKSHRYFTQWIVMTDALWWFQVDIPLLIEAVLLLLIVWKMKRSSRIVFRQINGASQDNGDAEETTRLLVCSAVVAFITRIPDCLIHFFHFFHSSDLDFKIDWTIMRKLYGVLYLIKLVHPISTPIVCLALKSRFKNDLKAIVLGCCCRCLPGSRCRRALSPEPDNNGSNVFIRMDPIDEDSTVTRREENI